MKDLVISVVRFFVWLVLVISTFVGFGLGSASGHGVLGAIAGFVLGCFSAGLWFLLTSIHEKLTTLADIAVKNRTDQQNANGKKVKVEPAPNVINGIPKWTGKPANS